jgi:hypothetical protein
MSITTNEPLNLKKLDSNLWMSTLDQTDERGTYHGKTQSIWITTNEPLSKEQRARFEELGVTLPNAAPAYSKGSSFVYTGELQEGANLKAFLGLPTISKVRGSEVLTPLQESTPAREALTELRATSGAAYAFIELLGQEGVAQKAQRIILAAMENLVAPGEAEHEDSSAYKDCFVSVIQRAVLKASTTGTRHRDRITSTEQLAKELQDLVNEELSLDQHPTSQALARDVRLLGEQLESIARPRRVA